MRALYFLFKIATVDQDKKVPTTIIGSVVTIYGSLMILQLSMLYIAFIIIIILSFSINEFVYGVCRNMA